MFFTLGNNKYQSNTWMSPNSLYIFCPVIAFSSQALNPYPLHTALIASNMNRKKDYVFVYVCTLLRSFICPCPNASPTCLIYRNLATRTTRSLHTLTSMYKWPPKISLPLLFFCQVANLACSISNNEEGVKLVRMAATQIDSLCPQVNGLNVCYPSTIQGSITSCSSFIRCWQIVVHLTHCATYSL